MAYDLDAEVIATLRLCGESRGGPRWNKTLSTWRGMRSRCENPNDQGYCYYGALGVRCCKEWTDFRAFVCDMGLRPEGLSIDRINPFGNYEPNNCRWATDKEQGNNKRIHKWVDPNGWIGYLPRGLNTNSGRLGQALQYFWTTQTHCVHGHEFISENTYTYKKGNRTRRQCRVCIKQRYEESKKEHPLIRLINNRKANLV